MSYEWAHESPEQGNGVHSSLWTLQNPWSTAPASPHTQPLAQPQPFSEAREQGLHTAVRIGRNGGGGEQRHPRNHPKTTPNTGKRLLLPALSTAWHTEHAG